MSVAGKGDQVRVAAGVYEAVDFEHLFLLVDGAVDVQGGFNRFDHFLRQASAANPTTLTGVPVAFRDQIRARGFHAIVDRKGLDDREQAILANYRASQVSRGPTPCGADLAGLAGPYTCDQVDLLSQMALSDLSTSPPAASDIWGFVDLNTEREYALLGLYDGLAVIDVTNPTQPFEVGIVAGAHSVWRDVKVTQRYDQAAGRWRSHAYVSTDARGRLVVIDLTGLPNRVRLGRRSDTAAHNVYVSNVDYGTGVPVDPIGTPPLLQVLGSVRNRGAVRSFDVDDPLNLRQIVQPVAGYSHDATSMLVRDERAASCAAGGATCEILLDFNEDAVELWDFSDHTAPRLLSSITYDNAGYVHSGWWTEDGRFLFVHDELDEWQANLNTTVRVFDLADLHNPVHTATWTGPTAAIDHNGYVRGNRYFMSNYTRGITILDITNPRKPEEVGFFDTYSVSDSSSIIGAWGIYPFLPSGNLLVSDIGGGLFVLKGRIPVPDHGKIGFPSATFGGEEGDVITVSVVRTEGGTGSVSVDYTVLAGSAHASDFTASTGTLHWPDEADRTDGDDDVRRISVPLPRDRKHEPIERAFVRLANPTGGAVLDDTNVANVFIGDAGLAPSVGFAESRLAVDENAKRAIATVVRLGSPMGAVSVEYALDPLTAEQDADYLMPAGGKLAWEDGDATARTIVIPLVEDDVDEAEEQFEVRLSTPVGATLADHTLVVGINAENAAVTGFWLYDETRRQDLLEIRDGMVLAPKEFAGSPVIRVDVRNADAVASVGWTHSGSDQQRADNRTPYLFQAGVFRSEGEYRLSATPYSERGLGGNAGSPLTVSFAVAKPRSSDDATLSTLALSGIELDFEPDTFAYVVGTHAANATVTATPARGAQAAIAPGDADADEEGHQVELVVGANNIAVLVTAEDAKTTGVYNVLVVREWSIDGFLR